MQKDVTPLVRFGVAVPENLLHSFDRRLEEAGLPNRSEALRQLIREYVAQDTWENGGTVYGTITLTYNHHANDATGRLTELQHDFGEIITLADNRAADAAGHGAGSSFLFHSEYLFSFGLRAGGPKVCRAFEAHLFSCRTWSAPCRS